MDVKCFSSIHHERHCSALTSSSIKEKNPWSWAVNCTLSEDLTLQRYMYIGTVLVSSGWHYISFFTQKKKYIHVQKNKWGVPNHPYLKARAKLNCEERVWSSSLTTERSYGEREVSSSQLGLIPTQPANIPCVRKPEYPEKTDEFWWSIDWHRHKYHVSSNSRSQRWKKRKTNFYLPYFSSNSRSN